jgi:hypothetical protein
MRSSFTLVALLLPMLAAARPEPSIDLETAILRAGFLPANQPDQCFEPMYVAKFEGQSVSIRREPDGARRFGWAESISLVGKSVRYEAQNRGQFGGQLTAILKSDKRIPMINANVVSLAGVEKDLYVFTKNTTFGTGSIYVVEDFDSNPKSPRKPTTFLPDGPVYVAPHIRAPRGFWIVGGHSLSEVTLDDWGMLQVHSFDEFHLSSVSSFSADDRGVVIGTCGGVISIEVPCLRPPAPGSTKGCPARFYVPKKP